MRDEVPRLLPHRLGLHPLREGARHPGRAGPRLGRRLARRVRAADHRPRSHPVQPALRALPEPGAREHAGLRRRLLHGPARRGHRVRRRASTARRASGRSPRSTSSRRKSVIKDVARAMGFPPIEAQQIASLIPRRGPGEMYTIPEALEIEPKLKALVRDRADASRSCSRRRSKLEGLTRHAGMHAAGIVISEGPLWDHVPCFKNGEPSRHPVLQGRRRAGGPRQVRLPRPQDAHRHRHRAAPHQRARPICSKVEQAVRHRQDPARRQARRYQLHASRARRTGVFQLESSGMQQLFKDLEPDAFEDIVAAVALYRPGPLGTRHGEGLRRLQARAQADREDARPRRRAPRADLRRHRLPGAGHADRAGARGLLARRRRSAPPRDGQEEARGDGEAEGDLRRRRARARASTRRTRSASSGCSSSSRATASTRATRPRTRSSRTRPRT